MVNWKTTLCGLIAGVATALANYTGPNNWQGYVSAAALVALGIIAKDFNVTGGTVASGTTPAAK